MSGHGSNRWMNHVASPYGLAMLSYALFLFACLLPPSVYTSYVHEPDLMFLDPAVILFYSLCVAAFLFGVWLVDSGLPAEPERPPAIRSSIVFVLLLPIMAGIAATAFSAWRLVATNPEIVLWLLTRQGARLKSADAILIESTYLLPPLWLIGSVWYVFWRSFDLRIAGWRRWVVNLILFAGVMTVAAAAVLTLSRNLLMLVFSGLAISYLVRKSASGRLSLRFVLGAGASMAVCVGLLFAGASFLRGGRVDDQVNALFGYTVASYNRLAAIVNGELRYPFAGRGVYLSSFVSFSHLLNRVVPVARTMNWPAFLDVWSSEFAAVAKAGLDGDLIWSGAFGYIFSDLGWFSPPLLMVHGMISGVAWNWIRRGKMLGILIYPALGFCVLFWIGTNFLFDVHIVVLWLVALLLVGYDRLFVVREKASTP